MLLVLDVGNSYFKCAVYEDNKLVRQNQFLEKEAFLELENIFTFFSKINKTVLSQVAELRFEVKKCIEKHSELVLISHKTKLPFVNKYTTPNTLGVDRMVLAAGACIKYPNQNVLVIDAGTCVTFDIISSQNEYLGGAISPGLRMRYKALHHFTNKLPLLETQYPEDLVGNSTANAIHSGVVNGLLAEIEHVISQYFLKYSQLTIILTGGDTNFLAKRLKSTIFADANFLLESLYLLSLYSTHAND